MKKVKLPVFNYHPVEEDHYYVTQEQMDKLNSGELGLGPYGLYRTDKPSAPVVQIENTGE